MTELALFQKWETTIAHANRNNLEYHFLDGKIHIQSKNEKIGRIFTADNISEAIGFIWGYTKS